MKIQILALLALSQLAALAAPLDPIDPSKYPAPVRVACVGDSITQGVGAPRGKSYPNQLQELLGAQWQVKNFGVSGRTLLKKGDHPYWVEKAFQAAQDYARNAVVIMLGTNDTKPQNWVHQNEFYGDYKNLVETFKNLPAKPRVYISRPVPAPGAGNYGINQPNLDIEIPLIDKLAQEENIGVIDLHAPLVPHPELFPDRVHPNGAGAGIMARTIATVLTGKATTP